MGPDGAEGFSPGVAGRPQSGNRMEAHGPGDVVGLMCV